VVVANGHSAFDFDTSSPNVFWIFAIMWGRYLHDGERHKLKPHPPHGYKMVVR
jgi:hypothetical protein